MSKCYVVYLRAQFLTVFIFTCEFVDNTDNIIHLTVISQHVDMHVFILFAKLFITINNHFYLNKHDNTVCFTLLNISLYVMYNSCFESLPSVVPIKLVRSVHCGVPRCRLRCAAHCGTPYVHGQLWEKNGWQFSNRRIDTGTTRSL